MAFISKPKNNLNTKMKTYLLLLTYVHYASPLPMLKLGDYSWVLETTLNQYLLTSQFLLTAPPLQPIEPFLTSTTVSTPNIHSNNIGYTVPLEDLTWDLFRGLFVFRSSRELFMEKISAGITARISIGCTAQKSQWLVFCLQVTIYLEITYCAIVLHVHNRSL